ncbi:MAG: hypothetical protein WCI77_04935 [Candidatus Omnitrophota bacterium]
MRKIIGIISIALLCVFHFGCAQDWNEEKAKQEALRGIKYSIDISQYPAVDPDFDENQQAIKKGQQSIKDRFVTIDTQLPVYVVSKMDNKKNQQITMFYGMDGRLLIVRLFSSPDYPRASYMYCVGDTENGKYQPGQLRSFEFHVSLGHTYFFGADGSFQGHQQD